MLKRSKDHFWSYVSGSIEADETAIEAVIREVKEETTATIENLYSADYIVQFFDIKHNCLMVVPALLKKTTLCLLSNNPLVDTSFRFHN